MNMIEVKRVKVEERSTNSNVFEKLLLSFVDPSLQSVSKLLADDGRFVGISKMKYLATVNRMFTIIEDEFCEVDIRQGVALDGIPGAEAAEIKYWIGNHYSDRAREILGDGDKSDDVITLSFCCEFKDGKVVRIERPKHIITHEFSDKMAENN